MDDTIRAYLKENHIETRPYDDIYTYVPTIGECRGSDEQEQCQLSYLQ